MSYLYQAFDYLKQYNGDGWHLLFFLLAVLVLAACRESRRYGRPLLIYTAAFLVLFFCPVSAKILMEYCLEDAVYWRMLWLLPVPMGIAYAGTVLAGRLKKTWMRALCLTALSAAVILGGNDVYFGPDGRYEAAENAGKIPSEVIELCNVILADSETEEAGAVVPDILNAYVRTAAPQIRQAYGRWGGTGSSARKIKKQMSAASPDFSVIAACAKKLDCAYLIYAADASRDAQILESGYVRVGQAGAYTVYKLTF